MGINCSYNLWYDVAIMFGTNLYFNYDDINQGLYLLEDSLLSKRVHSIYNFRIALLSHNDRFGGIMLKELISLPRTHMVLQNCRATLLSMIGGRRITIGSWVKFCSVDCHSFVQALYIKDEEEFNLSNVCVNCVIDA